MKAMPRIAGRLFTLAALILPAIAHAELPPGYPAAYNEVVSAAEKEGKVVVYGATDTNSVQPLIKDFQALYPKLKVEYNDMSTTELYNRFISESAANATSADVTWSSSMDLQVKLVNDGYALTYRSPEVPKLPDWSVWKDEAYGTTYEPVVFLYNKRLLAADEIPQSHADLARLLAAKPERFQGKLTSYDVEKSGVGFLLATNDAKLNSAFWSLAKAFGQAGARYQASTGTMVERVSSGENLIAYNVLGSYAFAKAKKDASIAYIYPKDYTQVLSRVMFIAKKAKNPNAAKLWLDYILSKRGQTVLANQSDLYSLRSDVEGETTAAKLNKILGDSLKPIPVGPSLLAYLDQSKRLEFLRQWKLNAVKK